MGKNSKFERHESRLATTDEQGHRIFPYPEDVKGKWRNKRDVVFWFLILLYLVLPWIHIGGKQSILLNIVKREFTFFGHTFYGHDAPLLIFVFFGDSGFLWLRYKYLGPRVVWLGLSSNRLH